MNESIIIEIKRRAKLFVDDNFTNPSPSDYLVIETAMMIGASITLQGDEEKEAPSNIDDKILKLLFRTQPLPVGG